LAKQEEQAGLFRRGKKEKFNRTALAVTTLSGTVRDEPRPPIGAPMLTPRSLPSVLLLLTLAGCAAPARKEAAVDVAALKDAIQAREKEWSAAYLAANAAAVAALYTEDAASVPPTGDWQRGRGAIAQGNQSQFDSTTYTVRADITEEVIEVGANYVLEVGHYSSTGTAKSDGKPRTAAGRYVALWRKDADSIWRIHRDLGSEAPVKP
jgi:uncharacterized protein (TIGR02246 family)